MLTETTVSTFSPHSLSIIYSFASCMHSSISLLSHSSNPSFIFVILYTRPPFPHFYLILHPSLIHSLSSHLPPLPSIFPSSRLLCWTSWNVFFPPSPVCRSCSSCFSPLSIISRSITHLYMLSMRPRSSYCRALVTDFVHYWKRADH